MPDPALLNYTTGISVDRTSAECQKILAQAGASSAAVHFEDGEATGLSFRLKTPHGTREFTLPVNIGGAQKVLAEAQAQGKNRSVSKATMLSRQHAARVAWRVVKLWLEANLALIAAHMVTLDEVMLPYLNVGEDRTLYQAYREREDALPLES